MKQCPACQRTYTDDALSFCLEDGTPLQSVGTGSAIKPPTFGGDYDPNKTLAFVPRETSPPPVNAQPPAPVNQPPIQQPVWSPTPSYAPAPSMQPARKSGKGAIIAIVAVVLVLGIGAVVWLTVFNKENSTSNSTSRSSSTSSSNRAGVSNSSNTRGVSTNASGNANRGTASSNVLKDDFSEENWPTGDKAYGSFYQGGEYHMQGKAGIYIYMFPQNSLNYTTKDASVKVSARSVGGVSPDHGYGLVIHGKVNQDRRLEGYGFLIYTGSTPKYEIVHFTDGTPTAVAAWETSSAIHSGTGSNRIEVHTQGSQLSLYINGQFIKSVTDTTGTTDGIVGLYTTDTNEVAFDDMEIDR